MAKRCSNVLKTHAAGAVRITFAGNVPNVFMYLMMFHFRASKFLSLGHSSRTINSTCSLLCSRKSTLVCSSQLANQITWLWRSLFRTRTPDNVRKLVPSSVLSWAHWWGECSWPVEVVHVWPDHPAYKQSHNRTQRFPVVVLFTYAFSCSIFRFSLCHVHYLYSMQSSNTFYVPHRHLHTSLSELWYSIFFMWRLWVPLHVHLITTL